MLVPPPIAPPADSVISQPLSPASRIARRARRELSVTMGGLPRTFWYLWLGTLINRLGIFVSPFLTLFLTAQRGLTVEQATLMVSLEGAGSFAAHLSGGWLADRFGRKRVMAASFFATPVLLMALYGAGSIEMIALFAILFGYAVDLYRPAASAFIADVVRPEDRARAYMLRYWAVNLGAAIALSLAGFLATRSYALLFIGDAITTAAFGLVVLFLLPETRPARSAQPNPPPVREGVIRSLLRPSSTGGARWGKEKHILIFVLVFSAVTVLVNSVMGQSNVTLPLDMRAKGLTEADYGLAGGLNGLIIIVVTLPLSRLLAKAPRFRVLAAAALFVGVGFGVYCFAYSFPVFALGVALWTVGELLSAPLSTALIADVSPAHRRGFYQGIYGASWGVAAFVGPLVGGAVFQRFGSPTLWVGSFILCAWVAAFYLLYTGRLYGKAAAASHAIGE